MGKDAAFAALGLAEGAQTKEIRRAFRALSRETHPDTGGDAVRFAAIVTAYRWLQQVGLVRDDARRAASPAELRYRRLLVQPPEPTFTEPRPRRATVEPSSSSPTVNAAETFDAVLAREFGRAS